MSRRLSFPVGPSPRRRRSGTGRQRTGFTLIELLAALLLMAIVIPVAMQGMSIATRAGLMGQRKAAAIRVADSVLNDLIITNQTSQATSSGTTTEGGVTYAWTSEAQAWPEDPMLEVSVTVTYSVQGTEYTVSTSTLIDPAAPVLTSDLAL